MAYCGECGAELKGSEKHCPVCGAAIGRPEKGGHRKTSWSTQSLAVGIAVGVVIGLVASYFVASILVLELQSQIEELKEKIPSYLLGGWNVVATFEGTAHPYHRDTEYFHVPAADMRMNWTWSTSQEEPDFGIFPWKEGMVYSIRDFPHLPSEGTVYVHGLEEASYFLSIFSINVEQWKVTVEVFVPD